MGHATIVRVDGRQAGIAVSIDHSRFRFFSTIGDAYPVECGTFSSIDEISTAVRAELRKKRAAWPEIARWRVGV